jgi:PAS domain S-box-containing protein
MSISSHEALSVSYNPGMVILSVLISSFASYTALKLTSRVRSSPHRRRAAWLVAGTFVMGIGIWSMHFTAMLAHNLPVPVQYHWPTVLLALVISTFSSGIALFVMTFERVDTVKVVIASIVIGLGIAGLHYTAMGSMRLAAVCRYNPSLVSLSVVVAILTSFPAFWITFHFSQRLKAATVSREIGAASVMGAAISAMHYTGMASVTFFRSEMQPQWNNAVSISSLGAAGIVIVTLAVQILGAWMSFADQSLVIQKLETEEKNRFRQVADNLHEVLTLTNSDWSEILYVNRAYEKIWGRSIEDLYANSKSWLEGVHFDDRAKIEEAVRGLVRGEPLEGIECRIIRPDGSIAWVVIRGDPVLDTQNRIYRLVVSAQEITKRKRAESEVRQLSGRLLTLQDEERRSIARDLHDSTAQDLVALATILSQLYDSSLPEAKVRELLDQCLAVLDKSIREIRTLSYVLHPPALENSGLADAIRDYIEGFTKRSGIDVELEISATLGRMTRETELALFRIMQESLTNIHRHSGSSQAQIRTDRSPEMIRLEIIDKGHGMLNGEQRHGVGIPSMEERVKQIGGRLEIESTSRGTTVRVIIPMHE